MDGQFRLPFRSVNCGVRNQSEISDLLVFQIGWLMKDQDYRRRVTMEGSYGVQRTLYWGDYLDQS